MDGILNVNKPLDWTSHDVVAKVRSILQTKKVGHTGTLDPQATGVLILCVGKATRLASFLTEEDKEYIATVRLGIATDTMDASGKVLDERGDMGLSRDDVERAYRSFIGEIEQLPPMFSAVKKDGRRLYRLARAGETVERALRKVRVYTIELLDFHLPFLTFKIVCSKGTYIRVLAADMGSTLGCGAHLRASERTRVGRFHLRDSLTIEQIKGLAANSGIGSHIISMDQALDKYPVVRVDRAGARRVRNGNPVYRDDIVEATDQVDKGGLRVRIHGSTGELLAIGNTFSSGSADLGVKPVRVLV